MGQKKKTIKKPQQKYGETLQRSEKIDLGGGSK